jgi:DNA (cytosine-5)-methyltransferase 1
MPPPRVLSLFSGAGGLDYGLEAAGFRTAVTLEMDRDSCATMRASRPDWRVIERDIIEVPTEEMLEVGQWRRGEVDLLVGGPPCQPFSKAGYWSKGDTLRLDDPRAHTLSAYMRVVEQALPRAFLLENVEGLAFEGKDEGLRLLLDRLTQINRQTGSNYVPHLKVLSAASYGVPQLRERVFLVASREGTAFRFPEPRFAADEEDEALSLPLLRASQPRLPPLRTAWDALGDEEPPASEDLSPKGKWGSLLASIPEGMNYLHHTERGGGARLFGWRTRYWSFLLKLAKAKPSWTIQAQPGPAIGPFHWKSRRLSVRELCRLQTFPEDVQIVGGRTSAQKQLGNAVPSLLAEVLGREIRHQLLGLKPTSKPLRLLPPDRGTPPPPEPCAPVPAELLQLVGEHAAHPGTGKGNAARARRAREDAA